MSDFESLRQKQAAEYTGLLDEHFARLTWGAAQLRAERERKLGRLIAVAKERSPWHAARLAHLDANTVTEFDLPSIPTMSKQDMMAHFDEIVTDRRLSGALVEAHLDNLTDDAYLLDEYRVVASGGSSGTRGVFVYDWRGWLVLLLTLNRWRVRAQLADSRVGAQPRRAVVAAGKASHMSHAAVRTLGPQSGATNVPATLPLPDIVARLNEVQPTMLSGYPTMLAALAHESRERRLQIQPLLVTAMSEPLLAETRSAIEDTWKCPVLNYYGCSEGASAGACGMGRGMHLNEDECIFELVGSDGHAVAPGEHAARVYITPLFNDAQPLIRYELTDELTLIDEPCACGSAFRRIDDVEGRSDDLFHYRGGIVVHPLVFREALGGERDVLEYQVRQTADGATIKLRLDGDVDLVALRCSIESRLTRSGLDGSVVTLEPVHSFERPTTGKFKRFVPLART